MLIKINKAYFYVNVTVENKDIDLTTINRLF